MELVKTILTIVLLATSLVLIVSVVMQESNTSGVSSVMGGTDTYFGKGRSRSKEVLLAKITKISAGIFMVLCVALAVL